jgi:hypothetical protein
MTKTMTNTSPVGPRVNGRSVWTLTALAASMALALTACDLSKALEVPDPDVATPTSLEDITALPTLLAGAIGDFQVGLNGGGDGQVSTSALFTDELNWAETFPTRQEVDSRNINIINATMDGIFIGMQRGRVSSSRAATAFANLDPTNVGRPHALNLEGFSYIILGENYCSGVPFSTLTADGATEYGEPQTTAQIFTAAVARFDSALALVPATPNAAFVTQQNLARIGKGRALMNLNQYAQAKTAVAAVPTSFQYQLLHSENTGRQNNGLFNLVYDGRRFSVTNVEGVNGLPYRADNDPRVSWVAGTGTNAFGFDGTTPMFQERKYPIRAASITVADGIEARMIEAEADMATAPATAIATLNAARATVAGLAPLTDPGTAAARVDMLFKERAYWFWLTSHRLGDLRRLVRQYGRSSESVFPTGTFFKGGVYGPDVNFPVPFNEQNNPKFTQCIDRNA